MTPQEYLISFGQNSKEEKKSPTKQKDKLIFELDFSKFSDSKSDDISKSKEGNMTPPIKLNHAKKEANEEYMKLNKRILKKEWEQSLLDNPN